MGHQTGLAYSNTGLTIPINKGIRMFLVLPLIDLRIIPVKDLAFLTVYVIWSLKFSSGSIKNPKSFSDVVTLNGQIVSPLFIV